MLIVSLSPTQVPWLNSYLIVLCWYYYFLFLKLYSISILFKGQKKVFLLSFSDFEPLVESLKAVWHGHKLDFLKAAHLGRGAPNTEVVHLEDQRCSRILDYAKDKRPLILNFGSCT
uniref:Iodothyronine deiodinase n=1 Tax=Oryzias sinensis TaxID=183150 RepID=A0A8C7ZKI2_9TELE